MVTDVFRWDINSSAVVNQLSTSNLFDPGEADQYGVWSKLVPFSNRLSLKNITTTGNAFNGNLNIYIDDSTNGWTKGQIFRVALDNIDINGNNIKIWTSTSTGFNQEVANISPIQLITSTPYIEVVCMDPSNYIFEADILR